MLNLIINIKKKAKKLGFICHSVMLEAFALFTQCALVGLFDNLAIILKRCNSKFSV